jgi:uncharacterized sulfatase
MANRKPNIILLVLDTHRAERMSIYGYPNDITPALGALAEESTVFDWGIAPAQWTIPSHASMFTGLYPTVHQTYQSYNSLPENVPTVAELLSQNGYETVGFCNNPVVGVLDNGLKRGFHQFYNYSGTFPDVPEFGQDETLLRRMNHMVNTAFQKISVPIERQFARSPLLLKLAIMPMFVPFWTRLTKFKGNTQASVRDAADYLRHRFSTKSEQPFFMFINMMETHLPYHPPTYTLDKWAPYLKKDREAWDFLQLFNSQTYRWVAPLVDPFSEMERRVLSDVYDAEVAYQDQQLRKVFQTLRKSGQADNTMLIVVSDHGESMGDHQFMGHGFAIYNDVSRVPLLVAYPQLFPASKRVEHEVSTRRVFHTILEAAGIEHEAFNRTVSDLSLSRAVGGKQQEVEGERVVAEAFPPDNFVSVMEMNNPDIIDRFRVRRMRRTIYEDGLKLITVGEQPDEMFDVRADYFETKNILDNLFGYENDAIRLQQNLEAFVLTAEAQRQGTAAGKKVDYSDNPEVLERLRGLGYIE